MPAMVPWRCGRVVLAVLAGLSLLAGQGMRQKRLDGRIWIGSQPAPHIAIVLANEYGSPVGQTMSDTEGRFNFDGLSGGTYRVFVTTAGYAPINESVDLSASGEEASISLFLRPMHETGPVASLGGHSLSAKAAHAYGQAQQFIAARKFKQAIAPLTATVAAAPQFVAGYVALGNAYWATRQRAKAEANWRKALALDPKQAEAAINLARLDNDRREWQPALVMLDAAPAAAHAAWTWRLEHGRSEYGLQQWASAYADLSAALPDGAKANPELYVLLSNLDIKAGRLPQARQALESYLQAAPGGAFAARAHAIVSQMIARGVPEPPSAAR